MSQSIRTNSGATASGSGHCSGDAGVVLPMAMVFVLVIGAVVVVLLDQAQTNFRSIWATRGVQERVYASNAGVNFGTAELQRFAVVNGSIPCGDGTQAGQSLGSIKVNNRLVTVTCSVAGNSQVVLGPQAWAAFITNSSGAIDTNGGPNNPKTVDGPVYNAGSFSLSNSSTLAVSHGDVVNYPGPANCTLPNNLTIAGAPLFGFLCPASGTATPPSPMTSWLTSNASLATTTAQSNTGNGSATCRVFMPGRYTGTGPALVSGNNTSNYFTSGVYFLDSIGAWSLTGTSVGGLSNTEDQGCTLENENDGGGAGQGVVFVLGGSSSVNVSGALTLEPFSAVSNSGNHGTSIYQILANTDTPLGFTNASPWFAKASTVKGTGTDIFSTSQHGVAAINGNVYTPAARVSLISNGNQGSASLAGGLVAAGLVMKTSANISNYGISAPSRQPNAVVTIIAVAAEAGSKPISATAILGVDSVTQALYVKSWTVSNP